MLLYIIRHAWAGEFGDPRWPNDDERPLTGEGRERFACMVETLAKRGFAPQAIATSPLLRCRQTAEIAARHLKRSPPVESLDALRPSSDLAVALEWACRQAGTCSEVAWVGHSPDVNEMAAALIGDQGALVRFAKGAVAAVAFDGLPVPTRGELKWLVTAKVLGC